MTRPPRARQPQRERMSGVDAAWWHMSRPHNPMVVVGMLGLRSAVALDALREIVWSRLRVHRRFLQRPVHDADGDHWEDDARFRIERHVVRHRLAKGQSMHDWLAALCLKPLPQTHPLWQFILVEHADRAAMVMRVHHCIGDGTALVRLLLAITDPESAPAMPLVPAKPVAEERAPQSLLDDLRRLLADAEAAIGAGAPAADDAPAQVAHLARVAVTLGGELIRLAEMPDETVTPFKQPPGTQRVVAWCEPLRQHDVRRVAQAFGCSVYAVLISCVAAALGAELHSRGHDPAKTEIRVLVPSPLRGTNRAAAMHGNHFGLVNLLLPLGISNPVARAWEVHRRLGALADTHQGLLMHLLLGLVGLLPSDARARALDFLSDKATAVLTLVPGPPAARTLAGVRVDDMMFAVPQAGDIGLGVSIFTYAGGIRVGLMSDSATLARPEIVLRQFEVEFARLIPLARALAEHKP